MPTHSTTPISGSTQALEGVSSQSTMATVVLRGFTVGLDTDVGQEFVADCARNIEGLVSEVEVKNKWDLTEADWAALAKNAALLDAVRRQRNQRIYNGTAAKEAAQHLFANAPRVLGEILTDRLVSPRHRVEAAKELRQVAVNDSDARASSGERFVINIDLGAGHKIVHEFAMPAKELAAQGDGENDD